MISTERQGGTLLVTMDRPERRNAVDLAALESLLAVFESVDDARVLVLTGTDGHFCSGADLSGVEDRSFARLVRAVLDGLCDLPIVTVAAIDGFALGAGTQLAVACDLRVATHGARFGIPAGRLGIVVDHWTVQRLALLAGAGHARAMLLAAETIGTGEALACGLVNREGTLDDALAWAEEISTLAPLSLAAHKLALNAIERSLPAAPDVEAAIERAWSSDDLAEGISAFKERRVPRFLGH